MMQAVLSNANHPEYGVVTIPFPIPREQFDHCIELVEALEIGNTSAQDCHVDEIRSVWPVLNRLEGKVVNLDELDYLPSGWTALMLARPHSFRLWSRSWI